MWNDADNRDSKNGCSSDDFGTEVSGGIARGWSGTLEGDSAVLKNPLEPIASSSFYGAIRSTTASQSLSPERPFVMITTPEPRCGSNSL